jgi:hypothetical protein
MLHAEMNKKQSRCSYANTLQVLSEQQKLGGASSDFLTKVCLALFPVFLSLSSSVALSLYASICTVKIYWILWSHMKVYWLVYYILLNYIVIIVCKYYSGDNSYNIHL